ncbi:hypothetical protein Tco_1434563, partial [Tanacetum coccineum]
YKSNAQDEVLGCYTSCEEAFQTGLVECHSGGWWRYLRWWILLKEADLEHGLEHAVSSYF